VSPIKSWKQIATSTSTRTNLTHSPSLSFLLLLLHGKLLLQPNHEDANGQGRRSRWSDGGVLIPSQGLLSLATLPHVFHMRLRRDFLRPRRNSGSPRPRVKARPALFRAPAQPPQAPPPAARYGRPSRRRQLRARQVRRRQMWLSPATESASPLRGECQAWRESDGGQS